MSRKTLYDARINPFLAMYEAQAIVVEKQQEIDRLVAEKEFIVGKLIREKLALEEKLKRLELETAKRGESSNNSLGHSEKLENFINTGYLDVWAAINGLKHELQEKIEENSTKNLNAIEELRIEIKDFFQSGPTTSRKDAATETEEIVDDLCVASTSSEPAPVETNSSEKGAQTSIQIEPKHPNDPISPEETRLRRILEALALPQREIARLKANCGREIHGISKRISQIDRQHMERRPKNHMYQELCITVDRPSQEGLEKDIKYCLERQACMGSDQQSILDLCAEIRVRINHLNLCDSPDEFRLKLVEYIEEATNDPQESGALVDGLQWALNYYEKKFKEITVKIEEGKRTIMAIDEIDLAVRGLRQLQSCQQLLRNVIKL